jgi:methyl-accepting chemotaxis protein
MRKFGDISIKWQLMAVCIALVVVPVALLGYISYASTQTSTYQQIESNLKQQATEIELLVKNIYDEVQLNNQSVQTEAHAIVSSEAEAVYRFVNSYQGENETLFNITASIKVGKTGYVYILDYAGNYIVSQNRAKDGVNIWSATDANGFHFIQDIISKARALTGDQIAYEMYPWQNAGDPAPREKIAAIVNIPARGWVVGVGAYYDELVDTSFETNKIQYLKDTLSKIVIGKTGYIFILDQNGSYVLSQNEQSDGKNLWNTKDASGNYFIQTMVNAGLSLQEGQTAVMYYSWQNEGESAARTKISAYTDFPAWKWVVAASAYQGDFLDGLNLLYMTTIIVVIVASIGGAIIAFMFARPMAKNFSKLAKQLDDISKGDLTVSVDDKKTGKNEMGKMTRALGTMVQNLRGLIKSVRTSSESVASMSQELSSTAQQVNAGMEQVSTATQQISQGTQKLAKLAEETARHVNTLSTVLQETGASTEKGVTVGKESMEVMQKIQQDSKKASESIENIQKSMGNTAETVESMHTSLEKIGELASMVTDVASQTEMLALNAAIEAARAGEAGRGFAVVADAVKELSDQSSQAANETLQSVSQVQAKGTEALNVAQKSTAQANEGAQVVKASIEGTKNVAESIQRINAMLQDVCAGVKKGASSVDAVVKTIDEVSSISQESASACEENSAAVEQQTASMNQVATSASKLSEVAVQLQKEMEKFKVQ